MTSNAARGTTDGGYLDLLRTAALFLVAAGAVGSVGFMLRAGRRTPLFLLVLFLFWVISPFVALAWTTMVSKRWSVPARATLYGVTLVVALGSLAVYGGYIQAPAGSPAAFVFVIVPPASLALLGTVVPAAALIARRPTQ